MVGRQNGRELVARAAGVVGDDGVGDVDRLLQVPQHAVGIERRAVVGELRHPLGEPGLVGVGDLAGNGLGVLRALAVDLLHLRDQALQHELGVARHAQRHGDVLVDVGGIERRLDDLDAGRHLDAEVGLRERAADPEDQVRLVEEGAHRLRDGEAARAQRQGMVLRKGALASEAGRHRNGQQLGQLLELGPGLGPMHAGARVDHRPLGGDQHLGGFTDGVGVGAGTYRLRAHVG